MTNEKKFVLFASKILKPSEIKRTTHLMRRYQNNEVVAYAYILREASKVQSFYEQKPLKKVENL